MSRVIGVLEEGLRKRIANYVLTRRNDDGGYTCVQFTDSNARDTFFALAVLKELDVALPDVERTIDWLRNFPLKDLVSIYYVNKALWVLGQPLVDVTGIIDELRNARGGYGTLDVDVESTSELETTLMSVELLKMLNRWFDEIETTNFVLRLNNPDGGFGKNGSSNVISTYHALRILILLNYGLKWLDVVKAYVLKCMSPSGGFTVRPEVEPAYMESTHAGFMSLRLLGFPTEGIHKTLRFVLACQNANGGFRRSLEHGISSFENAYHAVSILKELRVL